MAHIGRRIRGAIGMGVAWGGAGLLAGGAIEAVDNVVPGGVAAIHVIDMWPQTLALFGFICGVAFGVVLGVAGGGRRLDRFSHAEFARWGTTSGVLAGVVLMAIGAPVVFLAAAVLASAVAASGSLALARMATSRGLLAHGADAPPAVAERSGGANRR